jgi:hypothetical protein
MARYAVLVFVLAFSSAPLIAQTQDDKIQQLQNRLDELLRQANSIQSELNALKGAALAQPEDLTKIETVQTQPATAAATAATSEQTPTRETPPAALTDVQTINNVFNPAASKVFNPDMSVIGNFLGKAGRVNPYEFGAGDERPPIGFDEAEVSFQAFIDPYAKANFFLSLTPEGFELEEGYANFITLPYDLTAKAGKMKAFFGKDNTWHTHVRPWIDQPLVIHNLFGEEGLNDVGLSVSKVVPNPFNVFLEATGEVFSGSVENVFERHHQNDLFYNAHLKAFRDISENSNIEVGTSYARGSLAGADTGKNQFAGIDLTYRWKPLQRSIYNSFIGRLEAITNKRDDFDRRLKGFYASVDYQLERRWFAGVRVDASDRAITGEDIEPLRFSDRGASATLTFWPSEFSQIRGQLRRTRYGDVGRSVNELLLQLQFSIGAHGAHVF